MKITLLLLGIFWGFLAPMPPGVAVNPETKECGEFFGGDEYGSYTMPSPWEVTLNPPVPSASSSAEWDQNVRQYCEQNGYTYVPGNLGKVYGTHKYSNLYYTRQVTRLAPIICLLFLVVVVGLLVGLVIRKKRAKSKP